MKISYFMFAICMLMSALSSSEQQVKSFEFLAEKMPNLNKTLLDMHLTLYAGYVSQVNSLNDHLSELDRKRKDWTRADEFMYLAVERQYGFEYDGMKLHELYFENLGGIGALHLAPKVRALINKSYGSYEKWEKDFRRLCTMRGVGWVILYFNPITMKVRNAWISEHSKGLLEGERPLLIVDLWEHAYICQFGLDRMKYIDVIFSYLDWEVCEKRLIKALGITSKKVPKEKIKEVPVNPSPSS